MSENNSYEYVEISNELSPCNVENQIIIHGIVKGETVLSIRPDSFLMCNKPHRKSFLLFSFGAPIHPQTSFGVDQSFTLIFGMLLAQDILRNDEDIYNLTFGE
jgi:hypothetical protein